MQIAKTKTTTLDCTQYYDWSASTRWPTQAPKYRPRFWQRTLRQQKQQLL